MIKRTIEVSGPETRLFLRRGQIQVERKGEKIGQFPAEDTGVLIVDSPTTVYTHSTLTELIDRGAVVVLCGDDHLPHAVITPTAANSLQTERLAAQVSSKEPLRKRLWQQIVRAKIRNQANNLDHYPEEKIRLEQLIPRVRSGDPANVEAQASRIYWPAWLEGRIFRRRRSGDPPNNLLNYGYAILRAAVARAIAGSGLHPSIGLHHHSRYDSFCLADDLMEPLRPCVDRTVRELFQCGQDAINKDTKTEILAVLMEPVEIDGNRGPLMVELQKMTASLAACFAGEEKKLRIPMVP